MIFYKILIYQYFISNLSLNGGHAGSPLRALYTQHRNNMLNIVEADQYFTFCEVISLKIYTINIKNKLR